MDGYVVFNYPVTSIFREADNLSRLSASEQRELASRIEKKQMKEFMSVRVEFDALLLFPFSSLDDGAISDV
jgi:hypothetical protein